MVLISTTLNSETCDKKLIDVNYTLYKLIYHVFMSNSGIRTTPGPLHLQYSDDYNYR